MEPSTIPAGESSRDAVAALLAHGGTGWCAVAAELIRQYPDDRFPDVWVSGNPGALATVALGVLRETLAKMGGPVVPQDGSHVRVTVDTADGRTIVYEVRRAALPAAPSSPGQADQ